MSLLFFFKPRASVVVPTLGAVRPYIFVRALDDVDAGTARALDVDGQLNPNAGDNRTVSAPQSNVIKPRRGGIPLG